MSDRIIELGSDPKVLYPYSIFEKEWKDAGLYAICIAILTIRLSVRTSEEVPDLETGMNEDTLHEMWTKFSIDEDQWMSRVKYIARHLIDIGSI